VSLQQPIQTGTGTPVIYYICKDHLGSITGIMNSSGVMLEEYNYDPWGRRRNQTNWSYTNVSVPTYTSRGFTGHEHLDMFNLIDMNGRIYDPEIVRFLSPDPFIQDPYNLLNYNRYSYCMNNPLKYVDPSGYKKVPNYIEPVNCNPHWGEFGTRRGNSDENSDSGGGGGSGSDWLNSFLNNILHNPQLNITPSEFSNLYDNQMLNGTTSAVYYYYEGKGYSYTYNGVTYSSESWAYIGSLKITISSAQSGGDVRNIGGYTTVAGLKMEGVGYGLNDYAGSNHQYKYGQRGATGKVHSNQVVTRASKIQAYKYASYAKTAGRAVGLLGAGITAWEGAMDGDVTWGDAAQVGVAVATIFTPYGWAYGLVDLGVGLTTGHSVSERIGTAIDDW